MNDIVSFNFQLSFQQLFLLSLCLFIVFNLSAMNDEDIIRKRLLVDGDGTGDDRRINILLKQFQKWCNSDDDSYDLKTCRDQLLYQVSQCEYGFLKSRLTASMANRELENYESVKNEFNKTIETVKKDIIETKKEYKDAKVLMKNRLEYEVLSKVINEQPDRKDTNEKLVNLNNDIENLNQTAEKLAEKVEMRKKQFHVLFASLQQLKALLDEDSVDKSFIDISLESVDEDEKIVLSKDTAMELDQS